MAKRKKNRKKNQYLSRLIASAVVAVALPMTWVLLIADDHHAYAAEERTRDNLNLAQEQLSQFRSRFKRLPLTLTELRTFARSSGVGLNSYDAYGQRLQYIRLDDEHFVLRSFGADSIQNTILTAHDPNISKWNTLSDTTQYRFTHRLQGLSYPAALLLGADAPNKQWQARLYVDRAAGQSRLIVRHRQRGDLIMLALHEQVEEFMWLPDSHRLVYTATGSARYRDGIYLWDLLSDTTVNLMDFTGAKIGVRELADTSQMWLSLAGITLPGPQVYFFAAKAESAELNPAAFYSSDAFYALTLPEQSVTPPQIMRARIPTHLRSLAPWTDRDAQISTATSSARATAQWLALPLSGNVNDVIETWQESIGQSTVNALTPYSLWILASLFGDSYALLRDNKKLNKEANTLRSLGAEVANALCNQPLSPGYLHAFGQFAYQRFADDEPLPYPISTLHMR